MIRSNWEGPVNIGSEEMIAINDLAFLIASIAEKKIEINNIPGPVGVRGRNSDNNLIKKKLSWAPRFNLKLGLEKTYPWILSQVHSNE